LHVAAFSRFSDAAANSASESACPSRRPENAFRYRQHHKFGLYLTSGTRRDHV
jgi:hypothetical protein